MKRKLSYIRFDSVGGASGDMILGALAAVGADLPAIEAQLNRFFPEHLHIRSAPASGSGLNGIRLSVQAHHHHHHSDTRWPDAEQADADHTHAAHHHPPTETHGPDADHTAAVHTHEPHPHHTHRGMKEIAELINGSELSEKTKRLALAVFQRLAEAEAVIHGTTPDAVHFHEVGAWDSVADIVGGCIALEQLNIAGIACSPLPSGTGTLQCAHGVMPNPAPATQILLEGLAVVQTSEPFELVTPTGAAILATWLHALAAPPACCTPLKSGFGFGSRTLKERPNVLRATLLEESGQSVGSQGSELSRELTVLETNLDDCNPEWLGTLLDDLLEAGALDVWHTPIVMKKGRPAVKLSVLTDPQRADTCRRLIFRSTTTFGIRACRIERTELAREFIEVETRWGRIPVKCGVLNGQTITLAPEHERCAQLARAGGVTVKEVSTAAAQLAGGQLPR